MFADFFIGSVILSFPADNAPEIFSVISSMEIPFSDSRLDENTVSFKIPLYSYRKIKDKLPKTVKTEYYGIPKFIKKYKKRWGIAAGVLLFTVVTVISCSVIWSIEVTGNHTVSDDYIIDVLDEVGFSVGTKIRNVNADVINNKFLIKSDGISWISVNINGTHAKAEVRETENDDADKDDKMFNLVASEDGQIERIASVEGKPEVFINDTVSKGDILVSGIINYHDNLLRFESAKGSIFAKVTRNFDVEVPLKYETKKYTGNKKNEKEIIFFKKSINLIKNSRIPYKFYDTIYGVFDISVFSEILPVSVKNTEYREYTVKNTELSENEAKNEALTLYRQKLIETVGNDTLLNKTVTSSFDGNIYKIHCELYCIADIAQPSEIKITERADEIGTENSKTPVR